MPAIPVHVMVTLVDVIEDGSTDATTLRGTTARVKGSEDIDSPFLVAVTTTI